MVDDDAASAANIVMADHNSWSVRINDVAITNL
jgi:hypothetical protein